MLIRQCVCSGGGNWPASGAGQLVNNKHSILLVRTGIFQPESIEAITGIAGRFLSILIRKCTWRC